MGTFWLVFVALFLLLAPSNSARASCNTIPESPPRLQGTVGRIDRRLLIPGRGVVTLQPAPETAITKHDLVVSIIFKPPQETARTFFIAGDDRCETLDEPASSLDGPVCHQPRNCFTGHDVGLDVNADDGPPRITFHFPDTGVAGPVTLLALAPTGSESPRSAGAEDEELKIATSELATALATRTCDELAAPPSQHLAVCIDHVSDLSADPAVDPPLLAMPLTNDYQALCIPDGSATDASTPPCKGSAQDVVLSLDKGDLLMAVDWSNILRPDGAGQFVRRDVRASIVVQAVFGRKERISVPSADFLSIDSGTSAPGAPTPVFAPTELPQAPNEQTLVGTADKPMSVLRFSQRKQWDRLCKGGVNNAQACAGNSDCAPSQSEPSPQCVPIAPAHFACVGPKRDGLPCTRNAHCPAGGSCRRVSDTGNVCVLGDGTSTQVPCKQDGECGNSCRASAGSGGGGRVCARADGTQTAVACKRDEDCGMCGPGLFEFRNRHTNGIVRVNRFAKTTAGICETGADAGKPCTGGSTCSGGANCVSFRAEALPYPTPTPTP